MENIGKFLNEIMKDGLIKAERDRWRREINMFQPFPVKP